MGKSLNMQILGIISDTHGNVKLTSRALDLFREHGVSRILHCGDIGTVDIVQLFDDIPTEFVFGNCDPCTESLRRAIQNKNHICHNWFGKVEMNGKKIAFLHGHDLFRFESETENGTWDLLCYGHTHVPELRLVGETLVLNPGAIHRSPSPSVAVVDLSTMNVKTVRV
ncbi:MAG: metallophosphoesterase family protein [Thermoguttaceae bacterium]